MLNEATSKNTWLERHGASLNALANLCVLLLCLVAAVIVAVRWVSKPSPAKVAQSVGALGRSVAAQFPHNNRTVLFAVSAECGVCARETPLFRELESNYASRTGVGFVYLMPDIAEVGRRFLVDSRLTGLGYFAQEPAKFGMGVPAVAIIDRRGQVRFLVNGALDPTQRKRFDLALTEAE
ncbi:MAG TPA: hypothetical protein VEU96_19560 [Bryobacteraceae bacterium]|nr:hypothetical protein [Bryobacteraceae bacterium]